MHQMLVIGKADNGYVVEVRVPLKPKKSKEGKENDCICCEPSADKQYIVKEMSEISALIEKIMPMLDDDFSSEDEFDKAFKDAVDAA
jgi:hypothetical protein